MAEKSAILDYYRSRVKPHKSTVDQFMTKSSQVAKNLDVPLTDLLAVMDSESGLDSRIQNTSHPVNSGYATGLIQFIPSTAGMLIHGKNYNPKEDASNNYKVGREATEKLKSMSSVEQLDYVEKYFKPFISKLNSYADLYMVTFFPLATGRPNDFVLEAKNIPSAKLAKANPIFDLNKDNKITVGEIKEAFLKRIPSQFRADFEKGTGAVVETITETKRYAKRNWIPLTFVAIGTLGLIYVAVKYSKT